MKISTYERYARYFMGADLELPAHIRRRNITIMHLVNAFTGLLFFSISLPDSLYLIRIIGVFILSISVTMIFLMLRSHFYLRKIEIALEKFDAAD